MKKKKILWVIHNFYQNGITMFIINFFSKINLEKYEYILCISGNKIEQTLVKEINNLGVKVIFAPCRQKNVISYFFYIMACIKKDHIDAIHVHGNSSSISLDLLAAKLGGVKICIAHSHNSDCSIGILNKVLRPFLLMLCDYGIACSQEAANNMFGAKRRKKSCLILKNGINIEQFIYDEAGRENLRNEWNINEHTIVLGHVGVFNSQKNQQFLLPILKELIKSNPNYRLVLVGDGEKREIIQENAKNEGLSEYIIFTGKRDDVNKVMSAIDIFLFPSIFEGLGIVAIEAQAEGLPCLLSSEVPSIAKILYTTEFIELEQVAWVNAIKKINIGRVNDGNMLVRNSGWDINDCVKELEGFYLAAIGS